MNWLIGITAALGLVSAGFTFYRIMEFFNPGIGDTGHGMSYSDGGKLKQVSFKCDACGACYTDMHWRVRRTFWLGRLQPLSERLQWTCSWCFTKHKEAWPLLKDLGKKKEQAAAAPAESKKEEPKDPPPVEERYEAKP